jgi:DNA replicative helicase MCM subunit Mcm2 (Cdc46/Mcm family)
MSRFDLFFVIYDEKNDDEDHMIAQHIVNMHRLIDDRSHLSYSKEKLQNYIKVCRQMRPQFMKESAEILKEEYKKMRQSTVGQNNNTAYRYTVR